MIITLQNCKNFLAYIPHYFNNFNGIDIVVCQIFEKHGLWKTSDKLQSKRDFEYFILNSFCHKISLILEVLVHISLTAFRFRASKKYTNEYVDVEICRVLRIVDKFS